MGHSRMSFVIASDSHIGRVALRIADLDRSLEYYQHALGFEVLDRGSRDGRRNATLGVTGTPLVVLHERPGLRPVPRRGLLGLYHFAVLLPSRADLGRFVRHASARRVPFGGADHLVSEALYLVDPDGITIEVYRDRPRDEWRLSHGELAMASDPLDVDGLVDAAGDLPFTTLPAGTTIGHMHFYVGDLAAAARFYCDGLGFEKRVWTFPGALFVAAGGYHHHVGLNIWAAGAAMATAADAGLEEWVLHAGASTRAVVDRLVAQGYDVSADADGHVARDPWQIAVRIVP
jgi:catechol 2,3-dioxygenase